MYSVISILAHHEVDSNLEKIQNLIGDGQVVGQVLENDEHQYLQSRHESWDHPGEGAHTPDARDHSIQQLVWIYPGPALLQVRGGRNTTNDGEEDEGSGHDDGSGCSGELLI